MFYAQLPLTFPESKISKVFVFIWEGFPNTSEDVPIISERCRPDFRIFSRITLNNQNTRNVVVKQSKFVDLNITFSYICHEKIRFSHSSNLIEFWQIYDGCNFYDLQGRSWMGNRGRFVKWNLYNVSTNFIFKFWMWPQPIWCEVY